MPSNGIRIDETATTKMTKHDVIESNTTESEMQTATATPSEQQQQQQQQQTTTSDSSWPQLSTAPPLEPFYEDDALYEYVDDGGKKIEKVGSFEIYDFILPYSLVVGLKNRRTCSSIRGNTVYFR